MGKTKENKEEKIVEQPILEEEVKEFPEQDTFNEEDMSLVVEEDESNADENK